MRACCVSCVSCVLCCVVAWLLYYHDEVEERGDWYERGQRIDRRWEAWTTTYSHATTQPCASCVLASRASMRSPASLRSCVLCVTAQELIVNCKVLYSTSTLSSSLLSLISYLSPLTSHPSRLTSPLTSFSFSSQWIYIILNQHHSWILWRSYLGCTWAVNTPVNRWRSSQSTTSLTLSTWLMSARTIFLKVCSPSYSLLICISSCLPINACFDHGLYLLCLFHLSSLSTT